MACVARTKLTGTTFYSVSETHPGFTLFAPMTDNKVWLVNMVGKVIHSWTMPYKPGSHAELLPNGNLLYAARMENGPLPEFKGAGGKLMEVDKNGKLVWEYNEPYHHHTFKRLENGNTLIVKWAKVPAAIAKFVTGGVAGSERKGEMWGDVLEEITKEGKVVWTWKSWEHLDPVVDKICPICSRAEWTHITSVDVTKDGNILLNCSKTGSIIVVNKKTGKIDVRWGNGELSHPGQASVIKNGNFIVFDCGRHTQGEGQGFSRAIEIDSKTLKPFWGYEEDPPHYLFSSSMGSCQRLPNGNTLIVEGTTGRMMEVNPKNCMTWEYISPYRGTEDKNWYGYIFRAFRYGLDYAGIRKLYGLEKDWIMWDDLESNIKAAKLMAGEKQEEPKAAMSQEDLIRSRLEPLGY